MADPEKTKKQAAKRQAGYRARKKADPKEGRINSVVSITAVTRLEELAKESGLKKRQMLELLIEHGTLPAPSTIAALLLLKECGGEYEAAEIRRKSKYRDNPEFSELVRQQLYHEGIRKPRKAAAQSSN